MHRLWKQKVPGLKLGPVSFVFVRRKKEDLLSRPLQVEKSPAAFKEQLSALTNAHDDQTIV